jgi:regulator of protease activity HflC (stomatin/prohibitin superfamily)
MTIAVILTVLALASFIVLPLLAKGLKQQIPLTGTLKGVVSALAALAWIGACTYEVPEGHAGVLKTFGAASDDVLEPGLTLILPWQDVELLSTRAHVFRSKFDAQSSDLQKLAVDTAIVYRRLPDKIATIYKRVRQNSEGIDVVPAARDTMKANLANFKAPEMIEKRASASADIMRALQQRLNNYGLEVVQTSISNIDFDDLYDKTIEAKVIAGETAKQAENLLIEQKTRAEIREATQKGIAAGAAEKARGDAEAKRLKAAAEAYCTEILGLAQAAKIKIEGDADSERARLVAQSLRGNPEVLKFEAARAWDGSVPSFTQGVENLGLPFNLIPSHLQSSTEAAEKFDEAKGAEEIDRKVEEFLKRFQESPAPVK